MSKKSNVVFKKTINWVKSRIDRGILNNTSIDTLEEGISILKSEYKKEAKRFLRDLEVKKLFEKEYKDLISDNELAERHEGLNAYRLKDLKPELRKKVKQKILNSLLLIKNNQEKILPSLISRLSNFCTIDAEDIRGVIPSDKTFEEYLRGGEELDKMQDHAQFVILDQMHKMREAIDSAIRDSLGAFAVIWHTQLDKKVTGYPGGVNKPSKEHGDHYKREGKLYVLASSKEFQEGYITGDIYEQLDDGGVGVAIGCRCYLTSIYYLEDMPKKNLTKKGLEWLKMKH